MTVSGTWVPPGPSNSTTGRPSCSIERAGNRARSASTSNSGMEILAVGRETILARVGPVDAGRRVTPGGRP